MDLLTYLVIGLVIGFIYRGMEYPHEEGLVLSIVAWMVAWPLIIIATISLAIGMCIQYFLTYKS